ncbi:MAG: class F sortase [Candidatus Uhrbacteria bacterium]|nr:class F sortase [Candidatus Uhrbacteria bacterium]
MTVCVISAGAYAYSVFEESIRESEIKSSIAESFPEETEKEPEPMTFSEFIFTLPITNFIGRVDDVIDALPNKSKQKSAQEIRLPAATPTAKGLPVRIKIPSIGVDAPIKGVALASDGSMDVPKRPFETAWYERGARPGEAGTATIAGHVDWVNGADAVFADLHKVMPGDTISVQNDLGVYTSFVVRLLREYDAKEDASDVFYSYDGKSHLNLVTCSGAWDPSKKEFSKRLVVFADMVVEE